MTDFIPGDSYRIDIVGADSTLIIDSWLSQIKANVVNRDGVIQVDTTFGKLYGPLIGNIENDEGDILFNSDSRTVHMDVVGNVKDTNNNVIVDVNRSLLKGNLEGNIVNSVGDIIYDAGTSTLIVDRIVGDVYGTHNGEVNLVGTITGSFAGDLTGNSTGLHLGNVQGNVVGNLTGDIVTENGDMILEGSSGVLHGDLKGSIVRPDNNEPVLTWNETLEHHVFRSGIEHPDSHAPILKFTNNDQETSFRGNIEYFDATPVLELSRWEGTDKPSVLATFMGNVIGEVFAGEDQPVLTVNEGQVRLEGGATGEINIGYNATETLEVYADNISFKLQSNPVNTSNLGQINYFAFNGDHENKLPLNPGDHMAVFTTHAYDGIAYKIGGGMGFYANTEIEPDPDLEIYPTDFAITLSDGRNLPSAFWDNPTGLNFNGAGVLSVPIFKAKGHTEADLTDVSAEEGMIIFNTSTRKFQGYDGSNWVNLN
jgi:hypothetical protein